MENATPFGFTVSISIFQWGCRIPGELCSIILRYPYPIASSGPHFYENCGVECALGVFLLKSDQELNQKGENL